MTAERPTTPLTTLAGRIGRHTTVYGAGALVSVLFGLLNIAVLTRLLDPAPFGQLAVLLFFSALLTISYNLGSLQGAFSWAFGATAEEGGGVEQAAKGNAADDKRRALFTGLLLTSLIAASGSAIVFAFAPAFAGLLLDDTAAAAAVRWAAISGALGALWRLVSNVLRLERRPGAYVVLSSTRPALALGAAIGLVATGHGVKGAVAGIALGTAAAVLITLAATRSSYRVAVSRDDARQILRRGSPWVISGLALWAMQNGDLFLLSRYAAEHDVGVYRVAQRVGAVMSYAIAAFMMAWGPLSRDPLQAAVERDRPLGEGDAIVGQYYAFASLFLLLGLAAFADLLVSIAASGYSDAAPLIPLIGLGFVAYGAFVVVYRTSRAPNKLHAFILLTVISAAAFASFAIAAIPVWESYGAALAVVFGPLVGVAGLFIVSYRAGHVPPFEYRRIGAAALIALGCLAIALVGAQAGGAPGWALRALAVLAYPFLLVVLRIVPRGHLRALLTAGRSMLPRRPERRHLAARIGVLPERQLLLVAWLAGQRLAPSDVARSLGVPERELLVDFVQVIRELAEVGQSAEDDWRVGRYLLWRGHVGERDMLGAQLLAEGVDPFELDALAETTHDIRHVLHRRRVGALPRAAELAPGGADAVGDVAPVDRR